MADFNEGGWLVPKMRWWRAKRVCWHTLTWRYASLTTHDKNERDVKVND